VKARTWETEQEPGLYATYLIGPSSTIERACLTGLLPSGVNGKIPSNRLRLKGLLFAADQAFI
jgi:hypothetical protein